MSDVELVWVKYAKNGTIEEQDRIALPNLEWGNRETTTTYKSVKYTRAERLRASRDSDLPFDTVYSDSFKNLRKDKKDEWHRFYDKYAALPVWYKDIEDVWHYGFILNAAVTVTDARDFITVNNEPMGGQYEIDWDFIEIPPIGVNPGCYTITYGQYMIRDETWNTPTAPNGSTGWTIEFEPFGMSTIYSGTGDAGVFTLDNTVPGYNSNTTNGCPVFVLLTYYCGNSPLEPDVQFVSGTAQEDFVYIAQNTSNPGQLAILDIVLTELGLDPDKTDYDWDDVYTDWQAFLLANPDYILDVQNLGLTSLGLVNTMTNLKGLNAAHNLIAMTDINNLDLVALTHINLSYNRLAGDAGRRLAPMLPSLKHIDLSHNLMNEYYLGEKDQNGNTGVAATLPWLIDYYDISNNYLVFGDNGGFRIKKFYMRDNIYPLSDFFDAPNDFLNIDDLGEHFQDAEVIDLSNTSIQYSYNASTSVNRPEKRIDDLIAKIVADGHTLDEAKAIVIRAPKWELVEEPAQYDPDAIYVADPNISYIISDNSDSTIWLENQYAGILLEDGSGIISLE